jgi:CBS domain-containing protein
VIHLETRYVKSCQIISYIGAALDLQVEKLGKGLSKLRWNIVYRRGNCCRLMKYSIKNLMNAKLSYINQSNTAQEAAERMDKDKISALVVLDSNKNPVGIVTERDLVRRVCIEVVPPNRILVQDIMSTPIVTIDPYSPVETAADVMKQNQVRHLLVVDDADPSEPLGILSSRDFAVYIEHEYPEEK